MVCQLRPQQKRRRKAEEKAKGCGRALHEPTEGRGQGFGGEADPKEQRKNVERGSSILSNCDRGSVVDLTIKGHVSYLLVLDGRFLTAKFALKKKKINTSQFPPVEMDNACTKQTASKGLLNEIGP